jgi:hypothetical protein
MIVKTRFPLQDLKVWSNLSQTGIFVFFERLALYCWLRIGGSVLISARLEICIARDLNLQTYIWFFDQKENR